jgi:hypothetical protein
VDGVEFKFIIQDQASHHRLMPTHKGKHKDLVEQRTLSRSSNETGSRVNCFDTSHQPFTHI